MYNIKKIIKYKNVFDKNILFDRYKEKVNLIRGEK